MYCSMVSAIVSATSSSEYSWSKNKLKSGDLNLPRLSVLKCFLDDRNSRYGSLKGVNSSFVELLVMHYLKQGINNQKLDTPYPMEVDTPYRVIDQNTADGSYVEDASRNLMVKANKEISRKILELGCPEEEIDNEKRAAIDRDVWIDLIVETLTKIVDTQNKKVEELENTVGRFKEELKLFQTMFQGACGSSDMFFPTQAVSHEGYTGEQHASLTEELIKDADYAGMVHDTRRSYYGSSQFLGTSIVLDGHQKQEKKYRHLQYLRSEYIAISGCCAQNLSGMVSNAKTMGFEVSTTLHVTVTIKSALLYACNSVSTLALQHIESSPLYQ
ncbi:hypothetical protein Tco_0417283 [Tanacetum coccineum]